MKFLHRYSIILLLLILCNTTACSSYAELVINDRIIVPGETSGYTYSIPGSDQKPGFKPGKQKSLIIPSKKYLAKGKGFTPESRIMNKGIEEALKGNFIEAEILFEQISETITDGSIENNLAVVYECTKRKKDAMTMYINALIKSPENQCFKSNMLSFINQNKFKMEN